MKLFTTRRAPEKIKGLCEKLSRVTGQQVGYRLSGSEIVVYTDGDAAAVMQAVKELE